MQNKAPNMKCSGKLKLELVAKILPIPPPLQPPPL